MSSSGYIILLSLLLLLQLLMQGNGRPVHLVVMEDYICKVNPDYAYPPNCSVDKTVNPPRGYIDIQMHREVKAMQFELIVTLTVNKKQRTLMHLKNKDSCAYFEGRISGMLKTFKHVMDEMGTLPKKCPVDKDFRYLYPNIVIDSSKLPPFLVEGDFYIITRNTAGKDFVVSAEFKGKIKRNHDITIKDDKFN